MAFTLMMMGEGGSAIFIDAYTRLIHGMPACPHRAR